MPFDHTLSLGAKCHTTLNAVPCSSFFHRGLNMNKKQSESWVHVKGAAAGDFSEGQAMGGVQQVKDCDKVKEMRVRNSEKL